MNAALRGAALLACGVSLTLWMSGCSRSAAGAQPQGLAFKLEKITRSADPWGKALADINGDGLLDLIVAERGKLRVVAYLAPKWQEQVLRADIHPTTGIAAADVDGDGRVDLVVATDDGVVLLTAPDWRLSQIGAGNMHDVKVADLDGDGRMDVIGRNQTAFRKKPPTIALFMRSDSGWTPSQIEAPDGEGLEVTDLDGDDRPDIVANSVWYRNTGAAQADARFERRTYADKWDWPHASVAVGRIDADERKDILLAPAELAGQRYRVSWFSQPAHEGSGPWIEHVQMGDIEAVQHGLALADFDGDGRSDMLLAQMHQGADPDGVAVYLNAGDEAWPRIKLSDTGSHNVQVADIDGDGDLDVFGANWSTDDKRGEPVLELWRNQACDGAFASRVNRHVVGASGAPRTLFVLAGDLDNDGRIDLAAGPNWYRNPGVLSSRWLSASIGVDASNVLLLHDFDRDGYRDVLFTSWVDYQADPRVGIAWNLAGKGFAIGELAAGTAGDFPQGVAVIGQDERSTSVAVSWHNGAKSVELLDVPAQRTAAMTRSWISDVSQEEGLSAGDIDRDGDVDLLLGTRWLENTGKGWRTRVIAAGDAKPDRNALVDMNNDGRLDAVVGFEAISVEGKVVWYENPGDPAAASWREHAIAKVIGPMSLAVKDADGDGDPDVLVGEHNLEAPGKARLWLLRNDGEEHWSKQVMAVGDEHHDGLVATDLDGDGDLDIASVGWSHDRVHLYEGLAARCLAARKARGGPAAQ